MSVCPASSIPYLLFSAQVGIPTVSCCDYLSDLTSLRAVGRDHHHTASDSRPTVPAHLTRKCYEEFIVQRKRSLPGTYTSTLG